MKYRKLGKTGLDVSALSFGASSLGSVFRDINREDGIRTVHTALDMGINLIDVSPYYGLTKAESVLGEAIKDVPRDRFILSTKAGRYGESDFDFSEQRILDSLEKSLRRLNTDYVDILLLHDIEFVPIGKVLDGAVPALRKLKEQGKIRFAGISGLPVALFEQAVPLTDPDVILSYCHYSLNDSTLLGLLPLIEERQIGLINASPLSMGLLGTRDVPDWHPAGAEVRDACKRAAEFCAGHGVDIAKLAIQYSTADERIPTTLVSTANPDNIRRNVNWTEEPIDGELLRQVLDILEPVQGKTWASGRPEYNRSILT